MTRSSNQVRLGSEHAMALGIAPARRQAEICRRRTYGRARSKARDDRMRDRFMRPYLCHCAIVRIRARSPRKNELAVKNSVTMRERSLVVERFFLSASWQDRRLRRA